MVSSIGSSGYSASAFQPPSRKDIFSRADANGDGKLDTSEIEADLAANAPKDGPEGVSGKTPPSAADIVSQLDTDGDGSVSQAEFEAAPPPPKGGKFSPDTASTLLSAQEESTQALLKLLEKADSNGDGDLTEQEFTSFLKDATSKDDASTEDTSSADAFTKAVADLFTNLDVNGDGVVNSLDFQSSNSNSSSSSKTDSTTSLVA